MVSLPHFHSLNYPIDNFTGSMISVSIRHLHPWGLCTLNQPALCIILCHLFGCMFVYVSSYHAWLVFLCNLKGVPCLSNWPWCDLCCPLVCRLPLIDHQLWLLDFFGDAQMHLFYYGWGCPPCFLRTEMKSRSWSWWLVHYHKSYWYGNHILRNQNVIQITIMIIGARNLFIWQTQYMRLS